MISISRLMSTSPVPITGDIKFYQTTIREILDMGEEMYYSLLKIWDLSRSELIDNETEQTLILTDFEIWVRTIFQNPILRLRLINSVDLFLRTKIEFLSFSNTIMIGEEDSKILIDDKFYATMQEICHSIAHLGQNDENDQYKETQNMSAREKALIAKMKASAEKLNKIKNGDKNLDEQLVKQIISLVAVGHYTFNEVYEMTMIQMVYLLKKYVEIQQYELYTTLSPYMDSKKNQAPKHWLDT